MIDRGEVLDVASERGLRPDMIEKDYVLGWLLAAISSHPMLGPAWAFKGGTCLKKCYMETYRLSEDLDFTVEDESQLDESFLREVFGEVSTWLYERTGIEVPPDQSRFHTYRNRRGGLNVEGRVYYRGPLRAGGSIPRVKLDLTADERLVHSPVRRPVSHRYTDCPDDGMSARCYALVEVFGEKIRALGERARPRDLYDVIHMFWNGDLRPEGQAVLEVVDAKCRFKGIPIPDPTSLQRFRDEMEGDWQAMLGHQLPSLPPVEVFWSVLPEFFGWLRDETGPSAPQRIPVEKGEELVSDATSGVELGIGGSATLETIRFAAANRMCADLRFDGTVRRVEPYSLRRTGEDSPVLYFCDADSGERRTCRTDQIQGAEATGQPFVPRFANELMPVEGIL